MKATEKQKLEFKKYYLDNKEKILEKRYKVVRLWENEIKNLNLNQFKKKLMGGEN